ncbi:MAG: MFS transporter [Ferrovibrio sp.]|uniref:MFS transporter n=1 Tax=Ferrovibrio sp. TaxID=1917215 RepID=UPI00391C3B9E
MTVGIVSQPPMPAGRTRLFAALLGLYVAQGIPMYLYAAALPAILRDGGISRSAIGMIGILMAPMMLKFLWAPLVDRTPLRLFGLARLGHRRSWILPTQLGVIGLLVLFAFMPPTNMWVVLGLGFCVIMLSSTQDIATDGYATERLKASERGRGNAIQGGSVAIGVVIGSSLTLYLYSQYGWTPTILILAGLSGLTLLSTLLMDEPHADTVMPASPAAAQTRPSLRAALKDPITYSVLGFALIYRASEGITKAMEKPFLVDNGLSLEVIGYLSGASAATAGLFGAALAAWTIKRYGLWGTILGLGLLRSAVFLGCGVYAALGLQMHGLLILLVACNTVSRYMEIVALYTLFMGAAAKERAGTDFTLLSCAQLFIFMAGSLVSGVLADAVGYVGLFAVATLLSVLSLWAALRRVPANHPAMAVNN